MNKVLAAAACFLAATALPVVAQAQVYAGVNYTKLDQDDVYGFNKNDNSFDTGEVFAKLGGIINPYVSTEIRLGTSAKDKSGTYTFGSTNYDQTYRFNYNVGLYAKFGYPIGPVKPYALVGYTYGEEELTRGGSTTTGNLHDWSVGAGVDVDLGDHFGLNIEWTRYYDIGDVQFKGPSAGVYYRFH